VRTPPLVIAHRGDSAHRPENTLASFAGALEVGAVLVELDVQLTVDGHVVVLHDPTLDRTTTGRGNVREKTLAEVRAVSAGYPDRFGTAFAGERVPLLSEALALLRDRARVLVEIKTESVTDDVDGGVEARVAEEVRRAGMAHRVAVISFDHRAIVRLASLAPELTRGRLFGHTSADEVLAAARDAACEIVMPHKSQLSDELAGRVHAAGLKLATWVVDEPEELRQLARFGLYGVGSNRPGVLIDAIADGLLD
jgi:glycerophosphoryl diester phosphodiesterase